MQSIYTTRILELSHFELYTNLKMHEKNIKMNKNDSKIEGENDIAMMDHL